MKQYIQTRFEDDFGIEVKHNPEDKIVDDYTHILAKIKKCFEEGVSMYVETDFVQFLTDFKD